MTELPSTPPPGIALFDLDGTLIAWDCQLLFRHFVIRREPWRGVFLPVFLAFLPLAGLLGDAGMKRVFLCYLWKMNLETLAGYSRDFATSLMPAIYQELREKIEIHRKAGHLLILASASPVGAGLSLARYVATGKPTAVGEITIEILMTDSITGAVLGAGIDRRVGTQNVREAIDVWHTANDALVKWAERIREQLRIVRQSRKD